MLSRRARSVAERLRASGRRRLPLSEVRRAFAEADPATTGSRERRRMLAEVIDELAAAGVLRPSGTVESGTPDLPTQVTLFRGDQSARRVEPPVVWHPRLRDADGRPDPRGVLRAVNRWLFEQPGEPLPLRERALEITGDEKAFDGRLHPLLTLDLLRAYRVTPPLHRRRLGDGSVLLVVENWTTFHSIGRLLPRHGPVGEIAWGAGGGFESSVLSLLDDRPPSAIRYFGDLDADGLRIPATASALAEAEGLPPVLPASVLYTMLLACGTGQARAPVGSARAAELVGWLDPAHRDAVTASLVAGERFAQEAVGVRVLSEHGSWPDRLDDR